MAAFGERIGHGRMGSHALGSQVRSVGPSSLTAGPLARLHSARLQATAKFALPHLTLMHRPVPPHLSIPPRPTQYRGLQLRSKSEAIFARSFDLWPEPPIWIFEPDFKIGSYHPDFLLLMTDENEPLGFFGTVIEYKPATPTETYLRELTQRATAILQIKRDFYMQFLIVVGDPFNETSLRSVYQFTNGLWIDVSDEFSGFFDWWSDARHYRFDLR
jgi:hypothetical protein